MLSVRQLAVCYGALRAVSDVSLEVRKGQVVALIGANGAGKSTVLNTLIGALKPAGGDICLDGKPVTGQPSTRMVDAGMAIVPEARQLFGNMTVRENLEVGFARKAFARFDRRLFDERLQEVCAWFPRVGERLGQLAGSMSGGEQQMVAIARALMSKPRLLLLDEPSLGLSPLMVDAVLQIVKQLNDAGLTILLVEQNAEAALEVSDYAYVLEGGRSTLSGSAAQMLSDPRVREAYLGL